jgi:surface protein
MRDLFANCQKITSLDLSSFNTAKATNMRAIFYRSYQLKYINFENAIGISATTIEYLFSECYALLCLNLNSFFTKSTVNQRNSKRNFNSKVKICINDNSTYYLLFSDRTLNCSDICFQDYRKYDIKNNEFVAECDEDKFEYKSECHIDCPESTFRLLKNRRICVDEVPENYYLDYNDNVYKECYKLCKKCNISGDDINNNCDECIYNYIFLKESFVNKKNCFEKCDYYYFFDENNNYLCTDHHSCPKNYKLINVKNKCIDECINDDDNIYIYEYNNTCVSEIKHNSDSNQGVYIIPNIINDTEVYNIITDKVLSIYSPENGESQIIKGTDGDTVFQITTNQNDLDFINNPNLINNNLNISIIDLGECEITLRKIYNISDNDPLIFIKQETISDKASEKNVKFDIFEPYNKTKLNLSLCSENIMNLYVKMELNNDMKDINEQAKNLGYNIFDLKDPFYNDICTPFTSSSNTDILLSDRINIIFYNDDSTCQKNCNLSNYLQNSQYINCTCEVSSSSKETINTEKADKTYKFSAKKIYESFFDVLKYSNYKTLKCYKLAFTTNIFKNNNKGNIIIISFFSIYLIGVIMYIIRGIKPLNNKYKKEVNSRNETENDYKNNKINKNNMPPKRTNIENNSSKQIKIKGDKNKNENIVKNIKQKLMKRKSSYKKKINKKKKNTKIFNLNQINIIPNPIQVYSRKSVQTKLVKNFKPKYSKFNNSIISKIEMNKSLDNLMIKKQLNYDDFELNQLEFNEAMIHDKRPFLQIYFSIIKREHKIIFTFFICNDYNLLSIKISRFIFLIATDMALNVFFFTDESMHKIYINYGKYDIFQQIPQAIYTTIITNLIEVFLCFLSLTDTVMYRIKRLRNSKKKIRNEIKIVKCMKLKIFIFYLFTLIIFFIDWYIVITFCEVYPNTQIIYIKDCIISFVISLFLPFILYFFPSALRICALRGIKKGSKCIYKLSDIIPFF